MKITQDIDFIVDFNPCIYYPFQQSIFNEKLFSADITDCNQVLRNVDCLYMESSYLLSLTKCVEHRDFTINALLCDSHGNIYDPTNLGIKDYEYKILRTIMSSRESFDEDPTRILRALKYILQGYTPTDELQYALMAWTPRKIDTAHMISITRKIYLVTKERDKFIDLIHLFGLHQKFFGIPYDADVLQIQQSLEDLFFSNPSSILRF